MALVTETPIIKKDCQVPECKKAPKGFKTSRGLKGRMEKFHQVVIDVFSPMADTARVLFGEADQATQGNSHGETTPPKVVSEGDFLCGNCNTKCKSNEEAINQKCIEHDNAKAAKETDAQISFEETEEEDLVESLDDAEIYTTVDNVEIQITAKNMVGTIVNDVIQNIVQKKCHECESKDSVILNYNMLLDEKEVIITEKAAAVVGLLKTIKKLTEEKQAVAKKYKEVEKVKQRLVDKTKEVEVLKLEIATKNAMASSEINEE